MDDLVTGVNLALGLSNAGMCASADLNGDQAVTVDELVQAVNAALSGCPVARGRLGAGYTSAADRVK